LRFSNELRRLLADVFVLFLKTKNFHWHMTGCHFRDHLRLDEQTDQIFAVTDPIAERARKLGRRTLRPIGDISREQRLRDCDRDFVSAEEMFSEVPNMMCLRLVPEPALLVWDCPSLLARDNA
jgi:starvation-inducible DNA-binding protein